MVTQELIQPITVGSFLLTIWAKMMLPKIISALRRAHFSPWVLKHLNVGLFNPYSTVGTELPHFCNNIEIGCGENINV